MGRGCRCFLEVGIMVLKGKTRSIERGGREGWAGKAPSGAAPSSVYELVIIGKNVKQLLSSQLT